MLEGLLDADFDITDKDVMPGVKNWPRFIGRLQNIPKPKLVQGEKRNRHIWQGTEVLEALSKGAKKRYWTNNYQKRSRPHGSFGQKQNPYSNVLASW